MISRRPVKVPRPTRVKPALVGVIASFPELHAAVQTKQPPDLFELRLDCLLPITDRLEKELSRLPAPFIVTARDPREGGANNLSPDERLELLLHFLPCAKYIDVELRSARTFKPLLARAKSQNVRLILSFHDLKSAPSARSLRAKASLAKALGADVFKVACRTDSPAQLARLVDFTMAKDVDLAMSVMGIGKLGGISRLLLARCGSVLNYGSLHRSQIEGQLPIDLLRSALRR